MKKFPFFLAVFMLVNSLCFTSVYAENKVFEDDFSNGLSLWTSDNNEDFFVINDEKSLVYLSNDIYASSPLLCTQSFNGNNILEFELLYPKAQEIGLYVNYKDADNYYLVKWNTKNSKVYLIRRANGGEDEIILKKDCALKKGSNTVYLEFFENKYVLKLSDKTVFSKDNLSFAGNKIGFFGKNGSYKIDNVSVSGVFNELKEDEVVVRRLNIPESSLSGIIDGTNSKTDFETRSAALPEEIDLVKPAEVKGEVEIFVSPKGDDTNPGTIEKPFKTIARAINQVYMENAVSPKPKGIVLYLREGDYILDDTIKLDSAFSGTAEYPIVISSYNGEDVKLSNGILINSEDLTSVKDKSALSRIKPKYLDKIRCISLKNEFSAKYNRIHEVSMYSGGVPLTLARYPNVSEVQMGNIIRGGNKASSGTVTLDVPYGVVYEMYDRRPLKWQETGEILWNGCFQAMVTIYGEH